MEASSKLRDKFPPLITNAVVFPNSPPKIVCKSSQYVPLTTSSFLTQALILKSSLLLIAGSPVILILSLDPVVKLNDPAITSLE